MQISLSRLSNLGCNFLPADDVENECCNDDKEAKDGSDNRDDTDNCGNNLKYSAYEKEGCALFCRLGETGSVLHVIVSYYVKHSNCNVYECEEDTDDEEIKDCCYNGNNCCNENKVYSALGLRSVYDSLEVEETPNEQNGSADNHNIDDPAKNLIETYTATGNVIGEALKATEK